MDIKWLKDLEIVRIIKIIGLVDHIHYSIIFKIFSLIYQETRDGDLYYSSTAKSPYNERMWIINSDGTELQYYFYIFKTK